MIDFEQDARYAHARKLARLALECGDDAAAIGILKQSGMDAEAAEFVFVEWKEQMRGGAS